MVNRNTLTDLYRHMEWADAAVWTSVLASESGQTDAKLREYLYHLHVVQRAFLRAWRGEPREIPFPTFEDAPVTTIGETALQVALHSTYHRGQINARLRAVGGEPPLVDYIAWVWLGRPAAEWPSVVSPNAPN